MSKKGIEIIVITNTLYPYLRHNISVLSLPAGITYRFRYEEKYFKTNNFKELEGKLGLLVLRHYERGTFIPLRTFRFFRVEAFGHFIFSELEFLNYIKYESEEGSKKKEREREKYNDSISNILVTRNVQNKPRKEIDKLIIPVNPSEVCSIEIDDGSNFENTVRYWSNIVTLLGGIDYYTKVCFYLIASIKETDSDEEVKFFEGKKRKGFKLYAKKTYLMQIFQLMASKKVPPPPGFNIELRYIPQHILPMRDYELVDGTYDRLEFYLYLLPQEMRRVNTFIIVENKQQLVNPKNENESFSIPASFLHINIKWTKWEFIWKRILPIVFATVGVILYYLSSRIGSWLSCFLGVQMKPEFVQLFAFALFAIAAGSWSTFTGAFKATPGPKP